MRKSQLVGHCESGLVWGSVSYDGQLRNCPHSNKYWGNVGSLSLAETWPTLTKAVSSDLAPREGCSSCGVLEQCRGGCHLSKFMDHSVLLPLPSIPDRS
ncbi:SPASM domain-containing protein [Streptomyces sp. NPDC048411]|uniref:SPASM domain-containing protein n=1 Tax=Streptomyces sp. NPDC048411 TaxID=3157206 RepID=UPI003453C5A0